MVKVKRNEAKPKKVKQKRQNREKVKDDFEPSPSLKKSGKVKDNYQKPLSKSNGEKVRTSEAHKASPPPVEEGGDPASPPAWKQLFQKKTPSTYPGGARISKKEARQPHQAQAKRTAGYQGTIKVPSRDVQQMRTNIASGVTGNTYGAVTFKRRTQQAELRHRNRQSREEGLYVGNIRVRTQRGQTRHYRKISEDVHQFNGLMRVRKQGKDMHPSAAYLKSKTMQSHEQKEKYRNRKIKWNRLFKSREQPKHLKEKERKPRYDNKEKEIWYY